MLITVPLAQTSRQQLVTFVAKPRSFRTTSSFNAFSSLKSNRFSPRSLKPVQEIESNIMAYVQRVLSRSQIPSGKKHVLVALGDQNGIDRHGDHLTVTVDRSMPENLFEAHLQTAIGEAQSLADREKIDTVFVCIPERGQKD